MTKTISQYDQSFIARDTHDEAGHFVRVADATSVASKYFTHFRVTYNVSDLPTLVNYYRGTTQQRTQIGCTADVTGSLAGKYFTLNSAPDNKLYYIYYTVGGVGTNPNLANATGFAVDVAADDPAIVVAAATNFRIQNSLAGIFVSTRTNAVVDVKAVGFGTVDISTAGTTFFIIQPTLGQQDITATIIIEYSATSSPIYMGQELKGMYFNVFSGKFEKNNEVTLGDVTVESVTSDTPLIQNITLTLANTEYDISFPVNTNKLLVRARGTGTVQMSWTVGATSTNFITISPGSVYTEENLKLSSIRTLFIQTTKPGIVLEVLSWS